MDADYGSRCGIDAEWTDIWYACEHSGLATWGDWIELGQRPKCPRCDLGKWLPCLCMFNCGKPGCKGR